jgi:hypothetical protein
MAAVVNLLNLSRLSEAVRVGSTDRGFRNRERFRYGNLLPPWRLGLYPKGS